MCVCQCGGGGEVLSSNIVCGVCVCLPGSFTQVRNGYLDNAEDDAEGATPVMIKTVKGGDDPCVMSGCDITSAICHAAYQ